MGAIISTPQKEIETFDFSTFIRDLICFLEKKQSVTVSELFNFFGHMHVPMFGPSVFDYTHAQSSIQDTYLVGLCLGYRTFLLINPLATKEDRENYIKHYIIEMFSVIKLCFENKAVNTSFTFFSD